MNQPIRINFKKLLLGQSSAGPLVGDPSQFPFVVEDDKGVRLLGPETPVGDRVFPVMVAGHCYGRVLGDAAAQPFAQLAARLVEKEVERKTLGVETLEIYKEINLYYDISETISTMLEASKIAHLVIENAARLIPCTAASVMLLNEDRNQFESIASYGPAGYCTEIFKPNVGIAGSLMVTGKAEIINDVRADPRYVAGDRPVRSMLCAPLKVKNKAVGLINIISDAPRQYSARDLKLLKTLAFLAAGPIINAKLYHFILDRNPNFIMTSNNERIEYLNQSFLKFLGYSGIGEFFQEHPDAEHFFANIDDISYADLPNGKWLHYITHRPNRQHVIRLSNTKDPKGEATRFLITFKKFPELNKYIFTFIDISKVEEEKLREKMVSLGTVTAGIAHELKNPLNFVTNFATYTHELVDELREILKGDATQFAGLVGQEVDEILEDLGQNAKAIRDHGQRADKVVEGMMMLSKDRMGRKELTDINQLMLEHAEWAKGEVHRRLNQLDVQVDHLLDAQLERQMVVPESLGRVIINLIKNAYDSVQQKSLELGSAFKPKLELISEDLGNRYSFSISDNGHGIPAQLEGKVFNPFFTTKAPEHGSGLGLSICYDIVVHEHQGEIRIHSEEGRFARIQVILPKVLT